MRLTAWEKISAGGTIRTTGLIMLEQTGCPERVDFPQVQVIVAPVS